MAQSQIPTDQHAAIDMLAWAANLPVTLPTRSDSTPKRVRFTPELLRLPAAMSTSDIRVLSTRRGGGSISIEHLIFNAEPPVYRALALALIAYALSTQDEPLRLRLPDPPPMEVAQLVFWPSSASEIEKSGMKQRVTEVHYRARLPKDNPNYLTFEQLREDYPREHLPYWRPGSWDVEGGGVIRRGEPVCAHVQGTSPSLVWLGKYLLNLTLEDCNARLGYLYNMDPGESMAPYSAELRFVVCDPREGPLSLPPTPRTEAR